MPSLQKLPDSNSEVVDSRAADVITGRPRPPLAVGNPGTGQPVLEDTPSSLRSIALPALPENVFSVISIWRMFALVLKIDTPSAPLPEMAFPRTVVWPTIAPLAELTNSMPAPVWLVMVLPSIRCPPPCPVGPNRRSPLAEPEMRLLSTLMFCTLSADWFW